MTATEAVADTRWNHSQPENIGQPRPQTVETAMRAAQEFSAAAGLSIGHRKLVRLVRGYLATATAEQTFGAWVLAYSDPTGETAVRNVLSGASR